MHLMCRTFFVRARSAIEMVQSNSYHLSSIVALDLAFKRERTVGGQEWSRSGDDVDAAVGHAESFAGHAGPDAAVAVPFAPVETPVSLVGRAFTRHAAGDAL
jgi:hypothetical protein